MVNPATKLILRHATTILNAIPSGAPLLLVNPAVGMATALSQDGFRLSTWVLNAQAQTGAENEQFTAFLTIPQQVAGVILLVPKEKQLTAMLLANLRACLPINTPLWLVGHNETGIRSYSKQQYPGWQNFSKVASGNHCQLLLSQLNATAEFQPSAYQQNIPLVISDHETVNITSYPGVFSSGRIDAGTQLLLQHMPTNVAGKVLDFGCGAGVISAYLAHTRGVTELVASDINVMALAACNATLAAATTAHSVSYQVLASDGLQAVSGPFDWIVSNPPFHAGKQTNYQITQQFIQQSKQKLKAGGQLLLVANSFLPYREALASSFKKVTMVVATPQFTVWQAQ